MTAMTTDCGSVTIADLTAYPRDARVQIVDGTIYLGRPEAFDVPDLDALPDDGRRHELVDGVIVSSPAPSHIHQRAVTTLAANMYNILPRQLEVLVAPFDVDAGPHSQVQPDVLVIPRDDTDSPVPPPLLAVEVLSPSNRGHDLVTERNLYERAKVPSYWIVDPDEPSVTVLELGDDGSYVEVERVTGSGVVSVTKPHEMTFTPAELVR
ncbi:MAG: Uma2 family endonuclease [Acidothermales bacterium]|nr:Uma2 family endonuclease [Acidothermales bacterium]